MCARGAYVASVCQPKATADLSTIAQYQQLVIDQIKELNKVLRWQIENQDCRLNFVLLDLVIVKLFVFVDRSFANNADLTS